MKDARDQTHRVRDAAQTLTGWLSVTIAATGYPVAAQLGLQSTSW